MPPTEPPTDAVAPRESLSSYAKPDVRRSVFQLLNSAIPFALLWYVMLRSLEYPYWITLLLAVPTVGFLVRLFIIQHDCGHGAFLPRQAAANAIGFVIGVLTVTPYDYWRRTHAVHHATSGNLDRREMGDITTLTVAEYVALPRMRRLLYRLYRHPLVLFGIGPAYVFILKQRTPLDLPLSWKREWSSVLWTNLAIAAVVTLMISTIGLTAFLKVQLPITLLAGSAGVWLFYIQHQFENTYWRRQESWDYHDACLQGSSYYDLPGILNWFTGNIGVHHVHHLSSRIPNYRLHECMRANAFLQNPTRLTMTSSLRCVRLALWDEDAGRLVRFRDIRPWAGAQQS
ncbi:MAG TPA: fatty acid desaturase [Acidobacteriota bacterium]|nr:fatty acid desaturase [Acidobacteriota bacterium]